MSIPLDPNVPGDREKLYRLFLVKKTEGEMLKQRGYDLTRAMLMQPDLSFVEFNLDQFQDPRFGLERNYDGPTLPNDSPAFREFLKLREENNIFRGRLQFTSFYKSLDKRESAIVIYLTNEPGKQVSKSDFAIVDALIQSGNMNEEMKFDNYILITETGLNSVNSGKVKNRIFGYNIEVFRDVELAFSYVKHALAPINIKHVENVRASEWSKEEGVEVSKLPMILDSDMVSRWYRTYPFDIIQTEILGTTTDTIGYARVVRKTPIKQ